MQRLSVELGRAAHLDQGAGVKHVDAIADRESDAQVVRDQDQAHAPRCLDALDQREDVPLGRDVERGGGLVGDQDARVAGQGRGDPHPLPHPARQLERIAVGDRRVADPDLRESADHLLAPGVPAEARLLEQRFADDISAGQYRVEHRERVLQDQADLTAAQCLPLPLGELEQVAVPVTDLAAGDQGAGQEAHDRTGRHRLPAARLADDPDRFPRAQGEVNGRDNRVPAARTMRSIRSPSTSSTGPWAASWVTAGSDSGITGRPPGW